MMARVQEEEGSLYEWEMIGQILKMIPAFFSGILFHSHRTEFPSAFLLGILTFVTRKYVPQWRVLRICSNFAGNIQVKGQ